MKYVNLRKKKGPMSRESQPHQSCPICKVPVQQNSRYPRYVCGDCEQRASSADGRPLHFGDVGLPADYVAPPADADGDERLAHLRGVVLVAGYTAGYTDTGEDYNSHECFIDGIKCRADEARFGGIVIETVTDDDPGASPLIAAAHHRGGKGSGPARSRRDEPVVEPAALEDFPAAVRLAGFEGGAVYTAEVDGKFLVIVDESASLSILDDNDREGIEPVTCRTFHSGAARADYIAKRGWPPILK